MESENEWISPESMTQMPTSISGHLYAPLGSYRGMPFVTGGYGRYTGMNCQSGRTQIKTGYHTKAEIFNSSWISVTEYPNDPICHTLG